MRRFVFVALALLAATPAFAHAHLKAATPAENATVSTAPAEIVLEFSEAVEPEFSTIEVDDANGVRMDKGDAHRDAADARRLTVALQPLAPGTYKVVWHITSVDTHKTSGSYQF
jgi:methionine-rich copper-binding protein CopC